jgi:hypothetical protein
LIVILFLYYTEKGVTLLQSGLDGNGIGFEKKCAGDVEKGGEGESRIL